MVRAPCCEKMGVKRGPWTAEEDQILVSHIQKYGHDNWRALPKQAGLNRCGKSCRLRWINYLRPDIKRGNFTLEEEETIISLHEQLGNRWSAIAAKLPGRTDNEIKNMWHTNIKKRLGPIPGPQQRTSRRRKPNNNSSSTPASSFQSCSSTELFNSCTVSSSGMRESNSDAAGVANDVALLEEFPQLPEIDESFWTEALSLDTVDSTSMDFMEHCSKPMSSYSWETTEAIISNAWKHEDDMEFWLSVLLKAGDLDV